MKGKGPKADTKSVIWPKRSVQDPQLKATAKDLGVNKQRSAEGGKKTRSVTKDGTEMPQRTLGLSSGLLQDLCDSA